MKPFRINLDGHSLRLWLVPILILLLATPSSCNTALLVVDVQNCFLPGGSLAVAESDEIIPVINNIRRKYGNRFALTVFTQDWHCVDHVSFASEHDGKQPFDVITLQYSSNGTLCTGQTSPCTVAKSINQTLWPDHCVMNTTGAQFSKEIYRESTDIVVKKGYHCNIDSYSAFYDNGGFTKTELEDIMEQHGITTIFITGLAFDYCVYYTSKDAQKAGLEVYVVVDATRPVSLPDAYTVLKDMHTRGINVINSTDIDVLTSSSNIYTCSASVIMTSTLISSFVVVVFL